jgi:hypothetical protein
LDNFPILISLQLVAFWGLLVVFTAAYKIKLLVSGHPSIDRACIVVPGKFDGRLAISVLRNEQLFTKNWGFKTDQFSKGLNFQTFQIPPFAKSPNFLGLAFSCERDRQPTIKYNINQEVFILAID